MSKNTVPVSNKTRIQILLKQYSMINELKGLVFLFSSHKEEAKVFTGDIYSKLSKKNYFFVNTFAIMALVKAMLKNTAKLAYQNLTAFEFQAVCYSQLCCNAAVIVC